MKHRRLAAALAIGGLLVAAGAAAGAVGRGSAATGGTVLVVEEDLKAPVNGDQCAPDVAWCRVQSPLPATATATIGVVPSDTATVALRLETPLSSSKASVLNAEFRGVPLAHIEKLSYKTLVEEVSKSDPSQAPALVIEVQNGPQHVTLVWEPLEAGHTVTPTTWQTWDPDDAHEGGGWWSPQNYRLDEKVVATPSPGSASPPRPVQADKGAEGTLRFKQREATLGDIQGAMPAAVISRLGLNQGSGNEGLVAYADLLKVNETTFDFDVDHDVQVLFDDLCDPARTTWCGTATGGGSLTAAEDQQAYGRSAFQLATPNAASEVRVAATATATITLNDVGVLAYRTKVLTSHPTEGRVPRVFLELASATGTVTLDWQPPGQGAVTRGSWQSWTPSDATGWTARHSGDSPQASTASGSKLEDFEGELAEARVIAYGIEIPPGNAGLVSAVDGFHLNGTTYDFQGGLQDTASAAAATATATITLAVAGAVDAVKSKVPTQSPAATPTATPTPSASPSATNSASAGPGPQASVEAAAAEAKRTAEATVVTVLGMIPAPGVPAGPTPSASPTATATPTQSSGSTATPTQTPTQSSSTGGGSNGGSSSGSGGSTGGGSTGGGSTGGGSAGGGSTPTPTPTSSPASSPTSTPTVTSTPAPPACRTATITLDRSTIVATGAATVTWTAAPGSTALLYAYSRPSTTYRVVRSAQVGEDGTARSQIRPGTNTRLFALQEGCADSFASGSKVINVRTALTLSVKRNGPRNYTFSGDSLPARPGGLIVSLYRVTQDGRQILTAQTRANTGNGEWSVRRTFTGTGRFGFVVRTGQDLQNAPGSSNIRSLLVF